MLCQCPLAKEQIGRIAPWRENTLAWGIKEHLRKRMSERIYYRVCVYVRFSGGLFRDFALCSRLDAIRKQEECCYCVYSSILFNW